MKKLVRIRGVRTVTHRYVTDTIALDPSQFEILGAPQAEGPFAAWIMENGSALTENMDLPEIVRLKLSKLDYFNEARDQRIDESNIECL